MTVWVSAFSLGRDYITNAVTVVTFYIKSMLLFLGMAMNLRG